MTMRRRSLRIELEVILIIVDNQVAAAAAQVIGSAARYAASGRQKSSCLPLAA